MDKRECDIINSKIEHLEDEVEGLGGRVSIVETKQEVSHTILQSINTTLINIEHKLLEHIEKEDAMFRSVLVRLIGGLSVIVAGLIGFIFTNIM